MKKILFLLLISSSVYSQYLKTEPSDGYVLGRSGASSVDPFIQFFGTSIKIEADRANGSLLLRAPLVKVGDGSDGTLMLSDTVGLRANSVSGRLEQTTDSGSSFTQISGAGGGGGGENYNNAFSVDQNENAEDGTTGWVSSGGVFDVDEVDPLEGEKSFVWTPSAQGDTLKSPILDFDRDIFKGTSCQVNTTYIGGDENLSWSLVDGNDDVLAGFRNSNTTPKNQNKLPAHGISSSESIFFLCPSQADITGDAEKGNLYILFENTGVTAAPLIKFDKNYAGTLIGLAETTLPDSLSAKLDDSATVLSQSTTWINSTSIPSTGNKTVNYSGLGLSVIPKITVTAVSPCTTSFLNTVSVTEFSFGTRNGSNAQTDCSAEISLEKQGADAKQSVQTYKPIPKINEYKNSFNAYVSSGNLISRESGDWIDGNCTAPSGTLQRCNFISEIFSSPPNCTATLNAGSYSGKVSIVEITGTYITFQAYDGAGTESPRNFSFTCNRSIDEKLVTVNPILVGQVENSYASSGKQIRVESCRVNNNGTATAVGSLCGTWVDGLSVTSAGNVNINVKSGIFSENPNCSGTAFDRNLSFFTVSNSLIQTVTKSSADASINAAFFINCVGVK